MNSLSAWLRYRRSRIWPRAAGWRLDRPIATWIADALSVHEVRAVAPTISVCTYVPVPLTQPLFTATLPTASSTRRRLGMTRSWSAPTNDFANWIRREWSGSRQLSRLSTGVRLRRAELEPGLVLAEVVEHGEVGEVGQQALDRGGAAGADLGADRFLDRADDELGGQRRGGRRVRRLARGRCRPRRRGARPSAGAWPRLGRGRRAPRSAAPSPAAAARRRCAAGAARAARKPARQLAALRPASSTSSQSRSAAIS